MKKYGMSGLLVLIAMLVALSSCAKQDDGNTLYLYNWTYYTPQSVLDAFEQETGIKVVVDSFSSNEEMFAKLQAGGGKGYDLIIPSADYTQIMIKLGMLEKIDHARIPNISNISPIVKEKATYDPGMEYSVPYFMGTTGIAVDKARLEAAGIDYGQSYSIFADSRLKGRMSMLDDMRQVLGSALLTLDSSINTGDEDMLDEAARIVEDEWKPNLVKFDAEAYAKSFARGEFWVVQCYPEAVYAEVDEKDWDNIDFFIPEEGACMYIDNFVIPKGAKNIDGAYAFIDFFHRPEVHAMFLDEFNFPATANPAAEEYMTKKPFMSPNDLEGCSLILDLGEDLEKYNSRWEKIRYTD